MAGAKEIRSKIASIKSTQKITSAMEKVAVSKMRKAQQRMNLGRPYAERIRQVIGHLAEANAEYKHAFMVERPVKRVGYIIVSTDRGLCGGLNFNLFKALINNMKGLQQDGVQAEFCVIGKKGVSFFRSYGGNVVAAITDLGEQPAITDLIGSIKIMLDGFAEGRLDRLYIVSNKFVNTMTQKPTVEQLVPLAVDEGLEGDRLADRHADRCRVHDVRRGRADDAGRRRRDADGPRGRRGRGRGHANLPGGVRGLGQSPARAHLHRLRAGVSAGHRG